MPALLADVILAALPAAAILLYMARAGKAGASGRSGAAPAGRVGARPAGFVLRAATLGFLAIIPAGGAELGLSALFPWASGTEAGLGARLVSAFAIVALVEEATKLLAARMILAGKRGLGGRTGSIVCAICVGAGFAFGESVLYALRGSAVLVLRAFSAAPAHALFSGIAGCFLGSSLFDRGRKGAWAAGLACAVALHGLYDLLVGSPGYAPLAILVLLASWIALRRAFGIALKKDAADRNIPSYQSACSPIV